MSLDLNLADADSEEDAATLDDNQEDRHDKLPEPTLAAIDLALAECETPTAEQVVVRAPVSLSHGAESSEAVAPHEAGTPTAAPVTMEPGPAERESDSADMPLDDHQQFQGAVNAIDAALGEATLKPCSRVADLLADRANPSEVTPRFALRNLVSLLGWRKSTPTEPPAAIGLQLDHAVRLEAFRPEADVTPAAQVKNVTELEAQPTQQIPEQIKDPIEAQVQEPIEAQIEDPIETQIEAQVEAAVSEVRAEMTRALAEATQQNNVAQAALVAVQAELDDAKAKTKAREVDHTEQVEREQDVTARMEAARREAEAAHAAEVTELEARATQQVETAVGDVRAEMTRVLAEAAQQDNAALVAMQAELDKAKARDAQVEAARREAEVAHAAQVTQLEEQATQQVEAARQEAEVAHAAQMTELEAQTARQVQRQRERQEQVEAQIEAQVQDQIEDPIEAQVEAAVSEVRAEMTRALAEAAQQNSVAQAALVAVQAKLAHAKEARQAERVEQVAREQDVAARMEAALRETETAHAARVRELESLATQQVETAVGDVRAEMTRVLAEAAQQDNVALVAMQAELDNAKAREARVEAARREAEVAHAAQVIQLEEQATQQVETARQEAEVAPAAQMTELEAQTARQVQRQEQIEAQIEVQVQDQVKAAVREARAEMTGALTEATQQFNAALVTVRAELDTVKAPHVEQEQRLAEVRTEADLAQAEIERLHAERADQVEQARRESHRTADELAELETLLSTTREAHVAAAETFAKKQAETAKLRKAASAPRPATPDSVPTSPDDTAPAPVVAAWPSLLTVETPAPPVGRRSIFWITSTVVLGCFTGSLVGWVVIVWIV